MRMLHHISLPVADIQRSTRLYDAALQALGYRRVFSADDFSGYGIEEDKDLFALKETDDAANAGPQFHLAFGAPSREAVDRFYECALDNGAEGDGPPGIRERYGPAYYAAFIVDLDGHRIEAVINEAV